MNVIVNGEPVLLTANMSLQTLIEQRGLLGQRIAVEVNEEVIPKSRFGETPLNENDRVEIVHAIGGG